MNASFTGHRNMSEEIKLFPELLLLIIFLVMNAYLYCLPLSNNIETIAQAPWSNARGTEF